MPGIPGKTPSQTVAQLVDDLEPVRRRGRTGLLIAGWLGVGWAAAVAGILARGPLRPGAWADLGASPQFLLENLLGLLAGLSLAAVGFRLCIPGPRALAPARWALGLAALWVGANVVGLWNPALPPSMLGKRPGCLIEVVALGAPLLCGAMLTARRLAPLHPVATGALLGAAAGAIPALLMRFACMVEPTHVLLFHLGPVVLVAAAGAIAGSRILAD